MPRKRRSNAGEVKRKVRAGRRTIPASEFKAHCLRILDEVAEGEEVIVTKHGQEIAKVSPLHARKESSEGSWIGLVEITGDIVHTDWSDEFEATRSE